MAEVPASSSARPAITVAQVIFQKRKAVFLKVLAETGKVMVAANAAGWKTTTYLYHLRSEDEDFAEAWEAAIYASVDILEDEMVRRAVDGVHKPVFYKGEVVGTEIEYSDSLLALALRARRPDKFKGASGSAEVSVDVNVNARVGVAVLPMVSGNEADWEAQAGRLVEQQKTLPAFTVIDAKAVEKVDAPTGQKSELRNDAPTPEPKTGSYTKPFGITR